MAHAHPISDDDRLFIIDPTNRSITYDGDNIVLVKGDHNSEVFSFEIPRIVEGHDMSLCDHVRIHYSNTDRRRKNESKDIYYKNYCICCSFYSGRPIMRYGFQTTEQDCRRQVCP